MKPSARIRATSHRQRAAVAIEPERALVVEGGEELDGEERVAAGLLADEGGEGRGLGERGVDGVGDEPAEVVVGERAEHEVADRGAAAAHRLERAGHGVGRDRPRCRGRRR